MIESLVVMTSLDDDERLADDVATSCNDVDVETMVIGVSEVVLSIAEACVVSITVTTGV